MKRLILCSLLAIGFVPATVDAKAKKKDSEVKKALKEAYPDAQTEIIGTTEVNGVKVYDVKVTSKQGDSAAQITDYGDFLLYGMPHEYSAVRNDIQQNVAGLFKSAPQDIDMYRVTNYSVDFAGPKGKAYSARFDAVGRLKDINNAAEIKRMAGANAHGEKVSGEDAKKAEGYLKKYLPDAAVEGVYKADQGDGYWFVDTKGGELIVNNAGQVYSFREEIKKEDLPEPVLASIQKMFNADAIQHAYRGEFEYYQFDQESMTGQPIVVKMRPNGDIMEVRNDAARADEEAQQAKAKEAAKAAKKKG